MKKLFSLVLIVAVIAAGVVFVPKLVHKCDSCEETFFGAGYEPSAVVDLLSGEEGIICKECAEKQHVLEIGLGKSVEDFKKDLF